MEHGAYEFELERIKALIRERGARRVGLQLPEGLKTVTPRLAAEISNATGADVIISGNSCYGACDIDEKLASMVDLLFHFGHTDTFSFTTRTAVLKEEIEVKVIFVELRSTVDVKPVVERAAAEIKGDCV